MCLALQYMYGMYIWISARVLGFCFVLDLSGNPLEEYPCRQPCIRSCKHRSVRPLTLQNLQAPPERCIYMNRSPSIKRHNSAKAGCAGRTRYEKAIFNFQFYWPVIKPPGCDQQDCCRSKAWCEGRCTQGDPICHLARLD